MQVRIIVSGYVQGVFFRHSAKQQAEQLDLVGWVKNNPDGSVEALAQGEKKALDDFINWCKKGPSFAKVEKIEVKWNEKSENYDQFEIIR